MPPYKTNSAAQKFHGDDLDTMIGIAMLEHSGVSAFERGESLRDNPCPDEPMPRWAWSLGWRLGRHLAINGAGATR